VRTRRELAARVRELEAARRAEREHEREEILAAERARIAREMHDVVSHQVSLIAVQAGALQVGAQEAFGRDTAGTIRGLAVRTLDELRQMVAVLRTNGERADSLDPQPTLDDLDRLISESGIQVASSLTLAGDAPPPVQRAVYRTVQEALTNIRKHVPGATATVEVRQDGGEIVAVVSNPVREGPVLELPSGGTGIIGLRERAELLGGTLRVHRSSDAFAVELRIPLLPRGSSEGTQPGVES
jgi:signal transduction histidine kinase